MSITEALTQVADRIKKAKAENSQVQQRQPPGCPSWQHCETIDDHLFEALRLIEPD